MEFNTLNTRQEKHSVTITHITNDTALVFITRYRNLGGVPRATVKQINSLTSLADFTKTIQSLINLDDELFNLLCDYTDEHFNSSKGGETTK